MWKSASAMDWFIIALNIPPLSFSTLSVSSIYLSSSPASIILFLVAYLGSTFQYAPLIESHQPLVKQLNELLKNEIRVFQTITEIMRRNFNKQRRGIATS